MVANLAYCSKILVKDESDMDYTNKKKHTNSLEKLQRSESGKGFRLTLGKLPMNGKDFGAYTKNQNLRLNVDALKTFCSSDGFKAKKEDRLGYEHIFKTSEYHVTNGKGFETARLSLNPNSMGFLESTQKSITNKINFGSLTERKSIVEVNKLLSPWVTEEKFYDPKNKVN